MISSEQIEEWIHEVEQRPSSATLIIQYISLRLRNLVERNEALLAENLELRSGNKVEEYERRIAVLEYQVELLKRQLGSDTLDLITKTASDTISLIAFAIDGHVTRIDIKLDQFISDRVIASFESSLAQEMFTRILVTNPQEEIVFIFDSGRTVTSPVSSIPSAGRERLAWGQDLFVEPRGEEELAALLPAGKMSLYDYCLQTSRKGCLKKMIMTSFENNLIREYIGSGVKQKPDRTFSLTLAGKEDALVVASREGYLLSVPVSEVAYTAEEVLRLGTTDYLVSAFVPGKKSNLLAVTDNGKVLNREMSWLEPSESGKSRGQPIFSAARREAGVRIAGAAAVDKNDWCIVLSSDGRVGVYQASDILAAGSIAMIQGSVEVVDLTVFTIPVQSR